MKKNVNKTTNHCKNKFGKSNKRSAIRFIAKVVKLVTKDWIALPSSAESSPEENNWGKASFNGVMKSIPRDERKISIDWLRRDGTKNHRGTAINKIKPKQIIPAEILLFFTLLFTHLYTGTKIKAKKIAAIMDIKIGLSRRNESTIKMRKIPKEK